MFESSTFKSLKYYTSIFLFLFFFGRKGENVVQWNYPMSKAKILLAFCQKNLLRCEVKIAQISKKQKQNICWKQIRTFSTTIECDNT